MPAAAPVYGEDRARRLRTVLRVVLGLAVVLVALDLWAIAGVGLDEDGAVGFAVLVAVVAGVLLGWAGAALRLLPQRGRGAKVAAVGTGASLLLLALPMAVTWMGFVMVPIGLVVLLLALLPDDPDAVDEGR